MRRGGLAAPCDTRNVGEEPTSPSGTGRKRAYKPGLLATTDYSPNISVVAPRYYGRLHHSKYTSRNGQQRLRCINMPPHYKSSGLLHSLLDRARYTVNGQIYSSSLSVWFIYGLTSGTSFLGFCRRRRVLSCSGLLRYMVARPMHAYMQL